jgi:hypothetical protein
MDTVNSSLCGLAGLYTATQLSGVSSSKTSATGVHMKLSHDHATELLQNNGSKNRLCEIQTFMHTCSSFPAVNVRMAIRNRSKSFLIKNFQDD